MDFSTLQSLKEFLSVQPEYAFLTLSVLTNIVLFRMLVRAYEARFQVVVEWLPVVAQLSRMLNSAATKAKREKDVRPPQEITDGQ